MDVVPRTIFAGARGPGSAVSHSYCFWELWHWEYVGFSGQAFLPGTVLQAGGVFEEGSQISLEIKRWVQQALVPSELGMVTGIFYFSLISSQAHSKSVLLKRSCLGATASGRRRGSWSVCTPFILTVSLKLLSWWSRYFFSQMLLVWFNFFLNSYSSINRAWVVG